jgi:spermidine/putrescine transport system permease protein
MTDELAEWLQSGLAPSASAGSHPVAAPTGLPASPLPRFPTDHLTRLLWAAGSGVFLFIYLPLLVVILYAFHDAKIVAWPLEFGTLEWFRVLAHDRGIIDAAIASVKLALMAVVLALGVGVPGAFVLDRFSFPGKVVFERLVLLPLILPGIITGVAMLTFFSFLGISLSSGFPIIPGWPVVLGHGAALTSIVVTQVYARLRRFERAQEEASQDLYANEWQTFRHVTLPSIRSAVLGAALLVFTLSLDEIAVTFFLIGRQNTLPLQIWGLLRRGITPEVNAAATVVFLVSVIVIVVSARLMREDTA